MGKSKSDHPKRPDADRRVRQNNRLARALRVLELIQGRGRWNAKEIASQLECSERTVYRDLNVLEMAGITWYFDEDSKCYRVRPGWHFPVMSLTPDELVGQVTAMAITESQGFKVGPGAKPATRKLAATLTGVNQQLLDDAERLITVLDLKLADHSRSLEIIRTAQWALLEGRQVSGQYVSPYHDQPVKLTLHPYRLCLVQQAWYLIARPIDEVHPKTYRVTRFKTLRTLGTAAEVPEEFDLRAYFGNAWGVYRGATSYEVEIEFTKEASQLVTETTWHPSQRARHDGDGSVTLSFTVDGLEEIVWWVLGWSGRAKVIKPANLRAMVVDQLTKALEMNGEEADAKRPKDNRSSKVRTQ